MSRTEPMTAPVSKVLSREELVTEAGAWVNSPHPTSKHYERILDHDAAMRAERASLLNALQETLDALRLAYDRDVSSPELYEWAPDLRSVVKDTIRTSAAVVAQALASEGAGNG